MDYAYDQTEKALAELEREISKIYSQAARELQVKIDTYFEQFEERDEHQRALMEAGEITKEQYQLWRMAQIGRGERYVALQNEIAQRCNQANQVAVSYINDTTPGIYSLNHNYTAYTIEQVHGNVGFTIFNEQAIRRQLVDDPELFPAPRLDIPLDLKWNKQKMKEQLIGGIMQGESLDKLADRLQSVTDMNRVSALRNARTFVTGAQNAGRQDCDVKAAAMGIHRRKRWRSVKDGRTRHSHGLLDGQTVEIDEFFVSVLGSKMLYPGDRDHGADPSDLYNCRCCRESVEKEGIEAEPRQMRVQNPVYTKALEEEDKTRKKYERALAKEQAETDPEKRKTLRQKRIALQKQLKEQEAYRKSIQKNLVVNDMSYQEWIEWKNGETSLFNGVEKTAQFGDMAVFADKKYISSQEYRMKYRGITQKAKVDDAICKYSRSIIQQKSGTEKEVLVLLDANNGNLIHREYSKSDNKVDYTKRLYKAIENAKSQGKKIIAIHNHPNGLPPSADDCVSAAVHGYDLGVVCGHNGTVYTYQPAEMIYTEQECMQIHNAISIQLQGIRSEAVDKVWLEMLQLYKLKASARW